MESRYEITNFNDNTLLKIFLHKLKNVSKHCHESLELLFVLSGNVNVKMESKNYRLSEDDIILINSNQIHELHSSGCVMIILQINSNFVRNLFPPEANIRFNCNSSLHKDKALFTNIKILLAKLIKKNTAEGKYLEYINKALLYELFYELFSHHRFIDGVKKTESMKYMDRANRIIAYINENHSDYISLESLAEKEHLSVSYLSRFFKNNIGQTFKSFLTSVRLIHAVNDLISTDKTINRIAEDSGFSNTRSFVAAFKEEYDEYPNQYRKKNLISLPEQESIDYTNIEQGKYLSKLGRYLKDEINENVPVKNDSKMISTGEINAGRSYRKLNHNFKNIFSFGDGTALLLRENFSLLEEVRRDIGYSHILFYGFFDERIKDYIQTGAEIGYFNFNLADKIIDTVLMLNYKPMFKLGIEFNETSLISLLLRDDKSRDTVHVRWSNLIEAFIEHLISRYGISRVESWFFSLQEEYDRSKLSVDSSNEARFNNLYYVTFKAVKSKSRRIQFGPSPLMPYMIRDTPVMSIFYKFCTDNNCLPDFFTFKYFPVVPEEAKNPRRFLLDKNPDSFCEYVTYIRNTLKELGATNTPIYLTDWNSSTSSTDLLNDTCFKSAYIVRNILRNYDKLDSFGYWLLSDDNPEFPTGKELFHGGMGLFTKNGIKKPAYYALWLLSMLGDNLISNDEGYFITEKNGSYQMLLYNYSHYSSLYASGERFDMTFYERYTPFVDSRGLELNINLNHIRNGDYSITSYILNRNDGSCFDEWLRMSALPLTSSEEVENLKAKSIPAMRKKIITVSENKISITAELEMHEVRLIKLEKMQ